MTNEKKLKLKKAAIRSYRIDTFFWGWMWCCVYNLVTDNMLSGKYIADSFGLTLGLFVFAAVYASYLGRKTRLPVDDVASADR